MRPTRILFIYLLLASLLAGLWFLLPDWEGVPAGQMWESVFRPIKVDTVTVISDAPAEEGLSAPTIGQLVVFVDTIAVPPLLCIDSIIGRKGKVRILYYGDSQIEGDRVTSGLRRYLQSKYGGSGPGLFLPVMPVMYTRSFEIVSSPNWKRYSYVSYMDEEISHKRLGPMAAYTRFVTSNTDSAKLQVATVKIIAAQQADSLASKLDEVTILYSNSDDSTHVIIADNYRFYYSGYLSASDRITSLKVPTRGASSITITFKGRVSPYIYGISISDTTGVTVDNLPLRGSAGFDFTMMDRQCLTDGLHILDPDIIFLHFGLNVVKNVRSEYSFYKKGIYRQIELLKRVAPNAKIVLVGVTDIAGNFDNKLSSYENIPALVKSQSGAADSSGVYFWDAWVAMGGVNSIVKWAEMVPPLAKSDLTHFTMEGADSLTKLLINDLFHSHDSLVEKVIEVEIPEEQVMAEIIVNNKEGAFPGVKRILSGIFRFDPDEPFIFTSLPFWIFFLFLVAGYTLFYRGRSVRSLYLLAFSLYFYYKAGGLFFGLLIFSTLIDYSLGRLIALSTKARVRKTWLVISLVSNLGMLAYFKYATFINNLVNDIAGTDFQVTNWLSIWSNSILGSSFDTSVIILPVGISFFTFQTISYTVDVYRRKVEPVKNLFDFGFYVSFFPQLVAGPIVRASEFIPQIYQDFQLHKREFGQALFLIINGLVKKMVISDYISVNFVDRVFHDPSLYSGFENLAAVYGYGLQIYCDFSGYTDIALGVALILGFRLPLNFNSPYKAISLSDFWKRWHISLSRWLRDYLYIPLGGSRGGAIHTGFTLMVTMLLGGLWHGASIKFLVWGGLHGFGLVIEKALSRLRFLKGKAGRIISLVITFNFVSFCWIFFRGESFGQVTIMISQIVNDFGFSTIGMVFKGYHVVFSMIIAGYMIHFLPFRVKEAYRALFIKIPLVVKIMVVIAVAIILTLIGGSSAQPFIYFRF